MEHEGFHPTVYAQKTLPNQLNVKGSLRKLGFKKLKETEKDIA